MRETRLLSVQTVFFSKQLSGGTSAAGLGPPVPEIYCLIPRPKAPMLAWKTLGGGVGVGVGGRGGGTGGV